MDEHTIHWAATMDIIPFWFPWETPPQGPFPQLAQDITYCITVQP